MCDSTLRPPRTAATCGSAVVLRAGGRGFRPRTARTPRAHRRGFTRRYRRSVSVGAGMSDRLPASAQRAGQALGGEALPAEISDRAGVGRTTRAKALGALKRTGLIADTRPVRLTPTDRAATPLEQPAGVSHSRARSPLRELPRSSLRPVRGAAYGVGLGAQQPPGRPSRSPPPDHRRWLFARGRRLGEFGPCDGRSARRTARGASSCWDR